MMCDKCFTNALFPCSDCTRAGRQSFGSGPHQRAGPAGPNHDPAADGVLQQRRPSRRHLRKSRSVCSEVSDTANRHPNTTYPHTGLSICIFVLDIRASSYKMHNRYLIRLNALNLNKQTLKCFQQLQHHHLLSHMLKEFSLYEGN